LAALISAVRCDEPSVLLLAQRFPRWSVRSSCELSRQLPSRINVRQAHGVTHARAFRTSMAREQGGPVTHPMTDYFRDEVMSKRPYIRMEWCVQALSHPYRTEVQPEDGRIRH
jgi:hypothetical protein